MKRIRLAALTLPSPAALARGPLPMSRRLQVTILLLALAIAPNTRANAQGGGVGGQPKNPVNPTNPTDPNSGTVTSNEGASASIGSNGAGTSDGSDATTRGSAARRSAAPVPNFQEGVIALNIRDDDGALHEVQYLTKDGKLRFEVSDPKGGSAVIIIDPATQQMLMLIPSEKMYMERSLAVAGQPKPTTASTPKPVFTGKKEMIAGYECEHVLFTDDDGSRIDACVARGLGTFMRPPAGNPMNGPPARAKDDWSTKLGAGAFPLKVTKGSNVQFQVTRIEKKPLDASLFAAPKGWQKLSMPGMPAMR